MLLREEKGEESSFITSCKRILLTLVEGKELTRSRVPCKDPLLANVEAIPCSLMIIKLTSQPHKMESSIAFFTKPLPRLV